MPIPQKCPKCGGLLQAAGAESVRCIDCGGKYRLGQKPRKLPTSDPFPGIQTNASQAGPDTSPPPPVEPNPTAGGEGLGINVERRRRAEPKRSFFENLLLVFDWKFEHYLTPWIVRITWVLLLFMLALSVVSVVATSIADAIPKSDLKLELPAKEKKPEHKAGRKPEPKRDWNLAPENTSVSLQDILFGDRNSVAVGILRTFAAVFAAFWALLWTRVALELIIVVFNIAASLKRMESD